MNDFSFYFQLGFSHIMGWEALDHILFLIALCAIYTLADWKKVLILVTAFTIGHSITLAMSVFNLLRINGSWVEFFIPVTITLTAGYNLMHNKNTTKSKTGLNYLLALIFGLIHGLGFAQNLRFMLPKDAGIAIPLLSFNFGLEVGQILLITSILVLSYGLTRILKMNHRIWAVRLSLIVLIWSTWMAIQRWP